MFISLYNTLLCRVAGEFENTAAVEKFELSKEEYSTKTGTVQDYLK